MTSCELIIPCLNEAAALPALMARVPNDVAVIVVDNGSTDQSARVAAGLGARVITAAERGYGAAVDAGIRAAGADLVAVMDGDGTMDPAQLSPMIDLVGRGGADLVVGRRRPIARGDSPPHARVANAVLAGRIRARTGLPIHDIGPMRVCRRQALVDLGVRDRRFGYPVELLVRAARAGWRVTEFEIAYGPRAGGTRSKVSGSPLGSLRAARDLLKALP